ncbi:hypothetical protein [Chitinophaga sp. YR573]|uniref:hypothetical protein n=1 Tax=Chitinophaga sp. YR573 TaxID=1881040 RepID=UPI000B7E7984|nr:hypothetical protein [Chitinophaga sp. YR573]
MRHGENPQSQWDDPADFEKVLSSTVNTSLFDQLDTSTIQLIEQRLLKPYLNPSDNICVMQDKNYIGVSVVNVTNYADYAYSDQSGLKALADTGNQLPVGSVETTHGVIRLLCDAPFLFISGITDREGYFADDVNGTDANGNVKTEAQNFTAAFNIGVCLGYMIPKMVTFITQTQAKTSRVPESV